MLSIAPKGIQGFKFVSRKNTFKLDKLNYRVYNLVQTRLGGKGLWQLKAVHKLITMIIAVFQIFQKST